MPATGPEPSSGERARLLRPSRGVSIDVEALFRAHAPDLFAYVARRVPAGTAEDVVAETFVIAIRDAGAYEIRRGSARAWLFGIATNLLRHEWRSVERFARLAQRSAGTQTTWSDATDAVVERVDAHRDAVALEDALARLSDDDRELLLLIAWSGKTPSCAARVLGIPPGTARSRLHRIREALKSELSRQSVQQIGALP